MIGKNLRHDSGVGHVTGESVFIDDREALPSEVFVGVITSPIASGALIAMDAQELLADPDCLGFWQAKDIIDNNWGAVVHDQPLLVKDKISYMDEALAIFASTNRYRLEEMKKLVTIKTKEEQPVFSIQAAKKQNRTIYKIETPFTKGDIDTGFKKAAHILKGTFICGGQEHFYLESQAAIAYPGEDGQLEVHSSSQHPSETQRVIAQAVGLPLHKVVCVVKRMGGGFGGKESQAAPIAAYAGLVATKLKRPARVTLTKDEDMKITGKRHPFENEYEVGFDNDGKITALKACLQADGGAYTDLSASILERALFHIENAYHLENCHIDGVVYRTNNHSNTAFRGFGGPQGAMTIESIFEDMAKVLKIDALTLRERNVYQGENQKTPYGQVFENNMLPALFSGLKKTSHYEKRRNEINEFNAKKTGKLRGLSFTATKFGIAFTARFLNQGSALVNVHLDGTVQASTGATEMGQGVNSKIAQIIAHGFGIGYEDVKVMNTSTEKNHNTSPTAASSGSDINGAAALAAVNKVKGRLTELAILYFSGATSDDIQEYEVKKGAISADLVFKDHLVTQISTGKTIQFKELVNMAYFNRISLGGYAHYKTPKLGFSKKDIEGIAFNYFTQGCAVSEVEICEYTGEMKVLRSDIYMDLGRPLNPGIDRGQVCGAFIQGMGWVTSESLYYSKEGHLVTHSPTTYKIPSIQDTPREFNIDFITNDDNECNVHRSKAVGEPPFLLGMSAWTAIKNALSYRSQDKLVDIVSPATNEVILMKLTELKHAK